MGCTNSIQSETPKNLSPYKLNKGLMSLDVHLKNVRIALEIKKMKVQGCLSRNILELQKWLRLPLRSRNKVAEYQKIQESTWLQNQAHIYGVIIDYLKILQQYKHLLKNPENFSQLKPAMINILYAKQSIQNDDLEQFCTSILKQYPSLKETTIGQQKVLIVDEIVNHHRNDRMPSKKMVNKFALQLCDQNEDGLSISVINGTGNNFHYD